MGSEGDAGEESDRAGEDWTTFERIGISQLVPGAQIKLRTQGHEGFIELSVAKNGIVRIESWKDYPEHVGCEGIPWGGIEVNRAQEIGDHFELLGLGLVMEIETRGVEPDPNLEILDRILAERFINATEGIADDIENEVLAAILADTSVTRTVHGETGINWSSRQTRITYAIIELFMRIRENQLHFDYEDLLEITNCFARFLSDYVGDPGGATKCFEAELILETPGGRKKFVMTATLSIVDNCFLNFTLELKDPN